MKQKNRYCEDFKAITDSKAFCFFVLVVVILAYGFATFNMAVSCDDLQGYIYTGNRQNMLSAGRFTIHLIDHITFSTVQGPVAAYTSDIIAILGLIWSSVNFCILFRRVCGESISTAACTVFSCIFVSYPLIHELWEYIGAYRVVSFGFLCDSFALLLMYDVVHQKSPENWLKVIASCILMMLVSAGYESLVPVYIFCVFAVLALQVVYGAKKEKKLLEIIRQGLCYAGVLVVGLILRVVVHQLILFVRDLPPGTNGATEIVWGEHAFTTVLVRCFLRILEDYILRALIYMPLAELVIAAVILLIIGIIAGAKHGWSILLPGFGMYLSLIILCLVQGTVVGYRCCQVFAIFVAFTGMLVVMLSEKANKAWLRTGVLVLCAYLCFQQANQINYYLTLNYMRTEEELSVIRNIGTDLHADFDMSKPVVFVGDNYTLSSKINEAANIPITSRKWYIYETVFDLTDAFIDRIGFGGLIPTGTRIPQSNVNSVISFGLNAFDRNQEAMQKLFAFAGFDYIRPDVKSLYPEAEQYVIDNNVPGYPKNGYIQDVGDYLIVHIQ